MGHIRNILNILDIAKENLKVGQEAIFEAENDEKVDIEVVEDSIRLALDRVSHAIHALEQL